ncbi:nascent polypeptide-associated complex subunit alpha, muscle-specific form-like [Penaeus japonicus]|uniref:nascent polypeptide-associated complex subunit alpha, muscle-specific form-like n=1 Tax=Penaeus japonicus TaxID=27405 RepID=UPI001C70D501|nr:nascent polypeptide-associated complex subunit alpha, muscle-specific form-like [Penaeus japonicus]
MWRVTAVVVACLLGGLGGAAPGGNEEKKLTWAEVLGVPAPSPLLPAEEYEYEYYDDDDGDDRADDFFANHDYEYVDTADPSYTPPPPPPPAEEGEGEEKEEGGAGTQTADRRTLDLLYHWFMADPKKPSRPSLIEEVFRTIDNHIIEDLREWNANAFPHLPRKPVLKADGHRHAHAAAPAAAPAPALAPAATDDSLLVTDELGREHVVTINDIVTSLGHLDEQTLVDLLLGPPAPADKRSSTVALPSPQPPPALPQGTNLVPVLVPKPRPLVVLPPQQQQQQPIVLATLGGTQGELARPVRHTGPPKGPPKGAPKAAASLAAGQDDDVYVVQDESGAVQVVTLQDILSSLSALDSGSVNQLLFGAGGGVAPLLPIPSAQGQVATAPTPAPAPAPTTTPSPAAPSVNTDFDGNIHVQARPGTVTVDLRSHDWEASAAGQGGPEEGEEEGAGGSVVRRDDNGDIHISPAPGRPFTLDVRNIIALAEQAEQAGQTTGKGVPSKSTHNRLSDSPAKGGEEAPSRGQELLSFLSGVDALPTAIPPSAPPAYAPFPPRPRPRPHPEPRTQPQPAPPPGPGAPPADHARPDPGPAPLRLRGPRRHALRLPVAAGGRRRRRRAAVGSAGGGAGGAGARGSPQPPARVHPAGPAAAEAPGPRGRVRRRGDPVAAAHPPPRSAARTCSARQARGGVQWRPGAGGVAGEEGGGGGAGGASGRPVPARPRHAAPPTAGRAAFRAARPPTRRPRHSPGTAAARGRQGGPRPRQRDPEAGDGALGVTRLLRLLRRSLPLPLPLLLCPAPALQAPLGIPAEAPPAGAAEEEQRRRRPRAHSHRPDPLDPRQAPGPQFLRPAPRLQQRRGLQRGLRLRAQRQQHDDRRRRQPALRLVLPRRRHVALQDRRHQPLPQDAEDRQPQELRRHAPPLRLPLRLPAPLRPPSASLRPTPAGLRLPCYLRLSLELL